MGQVKNLTVAGHWRIVRGKRIWVKPYDKRIIR